MARFTGLIWLATLVSTVAAATQMAPAGDGPFPRVIWAEPVGDKDVEQDEIDGISVDPAGNTVISGIFRGSLVLGDEHFVSRGEGDVFVASYDSEGRIRWTQHLGSSGEDNTFDLATDGSGNIVLSGLFSDSMVVGNVTLQSAGAQDMFLIKLDADGDLVWARSFGGPNGDGGNEVSVLAGGGIAVSAMSHGEFTVDGRVFDAGGGARDAFAMRLDPEGQVLWVHPFNGPGVERIRAISLAETGEVFLGFQYRGSVQSEGMMVKSRGGWDGAAAKLDPGGRLEWLLPVGGPGTDNVRGVGAAPDGSVYISGVFAGPAFMVDRDVPAIGRKGDDFLIKLSSDGSPRWIVSFGGPGIGRGAELQADAAGVLVSSLIDDKVTIRRNRKVTGQVVSPTGLPTSYLAGFTPEGDTRFIYMPSPIGNGAGAFGDVLSVSRNGRFVAQAIRFRGAIEVGGRSFATPSRMDNVVVYLDLNGG